MGIAEQEAIDYNPVHTLLKKEGHLPFESETMHSFFSMCF